MLDDIGVTDIFHLPSSKQLFSEDCRLLHTTSMVRYPVFYRGSNYNGHTPRIETTALLRPYAVSIFPEELRQLKQPALIIPLGKAVERIIRIIREQQSNRHHTYLFGFPHPSGANGHRKKQLEQNKQAMQEIVRKFRMSIY